MVRSRLWQHPLVILFGFAVVVVATVAIVSYRNIISAQSAAISLTNTHRVLSTLEKTLADIGEAESSQRLYVITGNGEDLRAVGRATSVIEADLRLLTRLVAADRAQAARMRELATAIDQKLTYSRRVAAVRSASGFEAALALVRSRQGVAYMDRVRNVIAAMRAEEQRLLHIRAHRSRRESRATRWTLLVGSTLNVFLVALILWLVIRDERRGARIAVALEAARDSALQNAEMRAQFLTNMSHEIRTPMNGIIGMSGLLQSTKLDEDQREMVETVRSSADSLLAIINDILEFSQIDAGKLLIYHEDFNLRSVVDSVLDLLGATTRPNAVELGVLMDPQIPASVRGDAGRLRQVLTNLVANATKFTSEGTIIVHLNLESDRGDGRVRVRFGVTDTGLGMSEEQVARLFTPFTQVDVSTKRRYGGTGLGLAISKQLVELMGGTIGVQSAAGKGSTFWFVIPFETAKTQREKRNLGQTLDGLRLLVVASDTATRSRLRQPLEAWRMTTDEAATAPDAMAKLRVAAQNGTPFDVALIELAIPDSDGVLLSRLIKSDSSVSDVKIVILTTASDGLDRTVMRSVGIDTALSRPFEDSLLFDAIVSVTSGDDGGSAPAREAARAMRDDVHILVAEDNPVNQRVALRQLERLGYRADAVANGIEAIEALDRIWYDLVLMDCQMPEMDGFEATREIRVREAKSGRHTPIIALTANALQAARDECIAAGMDDYLSKPVRENDLERVMSGWLRRAVRDPLDEAVLERLRSLSAEPEEFLREIAVLFLEDAPARMTAIGEALNGQQAAEAAAAAHALKSSSGSMGATVIAALAGELESAATAGDLDRASRLFTRLSKEYPRVADRLQGIVNPA